MYNTRLDAVVRVIYSDFRRARASRTCCFGASLTGRVVAIRSDQRIAWFRKFITACAGENLVSNWTLTVKFG